jgi:hypothetical protein
MLQTILETIWNAINAPAGITLLAGGLLWGLNALYAKVPGWKKYEGTIISAVRFAEKEIPDSTSNKSLKRLDVALNLVLKVYEETTGKPASDKIAADLTEGIKIVHSRLESEGMLKK